MLRASDQRILPSVCPELASLYIESFDRLSVVRCDAAVTRLWGVLRGWVHGPRKIVAVDVSARP